MKEGGKALFIKKANTTEKNSSTTNKGYTLIEIIVVAAIITIAISSWLFVTVSTERLGKKEDLNQEYYRLLIKLQSTLRRDIRSATKIQLESYNEYMLDVIKSVSLEGPVIHKIRYKKISTRRVIHRIENDKITVWDFSQFPKSKKFTFELVFPVTAD